MPITHAKTNNMADWTQAELDAQIALGKFPPGTLLADIVLASDWNTAHTSPDIADVTGLQAALDGIGTLTTVEIDLGSAARTAGNFTISGLSGLTIGKPVNIFQAVGPYTGKGTSADEAEMDNVSVKASVTAADTITAYWNADGFVKGNFKFNYLVGA